MPSTPLTGSFASAVNNETSARTFSRTEGNGHNEWSRRPNGSTQTFRRSSIAAAQTNHSIQRDSNAATSDMNSMSAVTYVPPHLSGGRLAENIDERYSRSQLLDLFREQRENGDLNDGIADLFVGDLSEGAANGMSSTKWNRRDESSHDQPTGSEICWERNGTTEPLALYDMTDEEHELFTTSVNSPLKGPQQQGFRDGPHREGTAGRKSSVSQSSHLYGLSSPIASRPTNRRRETSESYPFPREALASPAAGAFSARDESQDFGFFRRRTDLHDTEAEQASDQQDREQGTNETPSRNTFGSLRRTNNPLSTGINGPSSPWSSTPSAPPMSPMGAFGNLGLGGSSAQSSASKRPEPGPSRESRFRNLMTKASIDEDSSHEYEERGLKGQPKVEEDAGSKDSGQGAGSALQRSPGLDFGTSDYGTYGHGSAVLGGKFEDSPQNRPRYPAFGTPRKQAGEDPSFSQRGTTEHRLLDSSNPESQHQGDAEPMSPTYTNPYASPQQRLANMRSDDSEDVDYGNAHLPGLGNFRQEAPRDAFASNRAPSFQMDRGQNFGPSSSKGFPSLGGLGGLAGLGGPDPWATGSRTATPNRERTTFGEFADQNTRSPATFQSPSFAGPPTGGFGAPGPIGRGNRLGSLLPTAMQEQSRGDVERRRHDELAQHSEPEAYEDSARGPLRDISSPLLGNRGKFDDFFGSSERSQGYREDDEDEGATTLQPLSTAPAQALSHQSSFQQQTPAQRSTAIGSSGPNQPPAAQQKTMVMPDRIRWVYRDPQGLVQGPWSGLEMHDWYRAGFFSPELLVKKLEDPDYEPLAQLIRRIGNSREPFLVPQIGIPHPTSSAQGSPWPSQSAVSPPATVGSTAQPPFAGSFPSFGTTLTADQQNALERRKQEEQYLMARQKEHLAQQQVLARQMQGQHGMHPQQLQHQSSAQSLNSQPSYGSMTSPGGFQAASPQTANPSFDAFRIGGRGGIGPIGSGVDNLGQIQEEVPSSLFERLEMGPDSRDRSGHAQPIGNSQYADDIVYDERTVRALNDRAQLRREQAEADAQSSFLEEHDSQQGNQRLRAFNELQAHRAREEAAQGRGFGDAFMGQQSGTVGRDEISNSTDERVRGSLMQQERTRQQTGPEVVPATDRHSLSLTEQVQKAASAKQSPAIQPWAKAPESIPPQSNSPLPAPAARRGGPSLAESLAAESLPQSQTPSVETPTTATSLAPWASQQQDTHKQPSLKEIQEAEARRAAKQEQIATSVRRAALEREVASQPPPPAPGLPSSSTWGNIESPTTPSAATSAWAKPAATKAAALPTGAKKTLQQIQLEEEAAAKKKRAQAANNAALLGSATNVAAPSSNKRYADLAGKSASPSPTAASVGAWTTVGASGKMKTTPTSSTPSTAPKTVSSSTVTNATSQAKKPPTAVPRASQANAQQQAQDEFRKWAVAELRPDLNKDIAVDEFVHTLLNFPADTDIITEVVHQNSRTMDSRHFAEEFVRRRGLADKGKVEAAPTRADHHSQEGKSTGGWSEVARKGSAPTSTQTKDEGNAFKIVAAKKKSGKK